MYRRPALYHPYKLSVPTSPAGFRLRDYVPRRCFNLFEGLGFTNTRSPDPSPLSSPSKGAQYPDDNAPPTIRLSDLLTSGFPKPSPAPVSEQCPKPNLNGVPIKDALPCRKSDRGPKHLSFKKDGSRSNIPPHRRSQQFKEKRESFRRKLHERHDRRLARSRSELSRLRREAHVLMSSQRMNSQDRIFREQSGNLEVDQQMEDGPGNWHEGMENEKREALKEEYFRHLEEEAMRADAQRQRAHQAAEREVREAQDYRFQNELARKAKEDRRKHKEQERQLREKERQQREEMIRRCQEEAYQLREEIRRLRRAEREYQQRQEQERQLREELERLRREAHERYLRDERERLAREQQEHQAGWRAEEAHRSTVEEQIRQQFVLYEAKWNELRSNNSIPPIDVREMPWPVLGVISSADQIAYQDVRAFLFHPQRPGVEGKSARDKVKSEVLRFHPDKFNTRIVPKVQYDHQTVAKEIAGAVARILTTIMNEEADQQK